MGKFRGGWLEGVTDGAKDAVESIAETSRYLASGRQRPGPKSRASQRLDAVASGG
jgi:hypothetical protein